MPARARVDFDERRAGRGDIDDPAEVLAAAARLLERGPRSAADVRRRLTRAGYRPPLVEGAVTRLLELGYLDDAAFARAWVESRDRSRPRGAYALRRELVNHGVGEEIVREVLADRVAEGSSQTRDEDGSPISADVAAARRLLERRAASLGRVPDPRRRRERAYALLVRNGFSPDVCRVVAASAAAIGDDEDHPPEGEE